jgi:hypothetical protein
MSAFAKTLQQEKDFTHESFAGLRNNVKNSRFELGDLDAAVNVDLDDTGRVSRRSGFGSRILSGPCHSVGPGGAGRCFVVSGTVLYEIFQDLSTTALVTGLTANQPVSYLVSGNRYYWSNGIQKGCIEPTGNRSWGIQVPSRISATVGSGGLRLGHEDTDTAGYMFTMTYLRNDGQESGAPAAGYLDVPDYGALVFDNLPVSSDPTVDRKIIYISTRNGEKLFRALVLTNATTSATYQSLGRLVTPLATQFLEPPVAGSIIAFQGGSMLIASGSTLRYSEPFAFELFDRRKYFNFSSTITIVFPTEDGTHVATQDAHFWLAGRSPDIYKSDQKTTYGAIPGTLDVCDGSLLGKGESDGFVGVWASKQGIVAGSGSGKLENLTDKRFLYPIQDRGAGVLRRVDGINQFIAVLAGSETPPPSVRSNAIIYPGPGSIGVTGH